MHPARIAGLHHSHRALGADVHAGYGQHLGATLALSLEQFFQRNVLLLAESAAQLLPAFAADEQHVAPFGLDAALIFAGLAHGFTLCRGVPPCPCRLPCANAQILCQKTLWPINGFMRFILSSF
jgi:hypothetical protein